MTAQGAVAGDVGDVGDVGDGVEGAGDDPRVAVDFHTGVADKPAFAARLVRKIRAQGHRVEVRGTVADLARLDALLWTQEPGDFVPHLCAPSMAALPRDWRPTPVLLIESGAPPAGAEGFDVRVNLGPAALDAGGGGDGGAAARRVVEVVGTDADDVRAGRARWQRWAAAGTTPAHHRHG